MEGQPWGGKPRLLDPGQPTSRCWQKAASAAHISASPQATAWAVVSATSLTTGCTSALPTGNLFRKAHGSTETQKQESRSPTRKCLLLLMKCCCFPCDPALSVCGRLAVASAQRWMQKPPVNGPGNGSSRGSCLPSLAGCCAT